MTTRNEDAGKSQHQHTSGIPCPVCAEAMPEKMELSPALTFREAFDLWIETQVLHQQGAWTNARYISPRTERDLRQYARAVELFVGKLPLGQVHAGTLRAYQRARAFCDPAIGWEKPAGANLINKEIGLLARILRASGCWNQHLEEHHQPLQATESETAIALTPEEQHLWLHTAAQRPEWRVVYWYSLVAFQSTAATNEMRALQLGDVDLRQGTIRVRGEGAKNKFRVRTIPIATKEMAAALHALIERAREMGATAPHHYLFPRHLHRRVYDPSRPMSVWGLRNEWDEVREATGLSGFTPYHTRHTALTRMAEAGVPLAVAMSMAGHMSPRMQQRYVAISMAAKQSWAMKAFAGVAWNGAAPGKKPPQGEMGYAQAAGW